MFMSSEKNVLKTSTESASYEFMELKYMYINEKIETFLASIKIHHIYESIMQK